MEEGLNTGVIYMITNIKNGLKYIGRAKSYSIRKGGSIVKHGANGRLKSHWSKVKINKMEIPLLYNDMKNYGEDAFKIKVLEVCLLIDINRKEEELILQHETYKPEIGYNMFIGDKKPIDPIQKKEYENKKSESNKNRANEGALRRTEGGTGLPPNIYRRKHGLFAQIKLPNQNGDTSLYNKAFFITADSEQVKLQKAQEWLTQIKAQHEQNNNNIINDV
jgi:hypothetical protein